MCHFFGTFQPNIKTFSAIFPHLNSKHFNFLLHSSLHKKQLDGNPTWVAQAVNRRCTPHCVYVCVAHVFFVFNESRAECDWALFNPIVCTWLKQHIWGLHNTTIIATGSYWHLCPTVIMRNVSEFAWIYLNLECYCFLVSICYGSTRGTASLKFHNGLISIIQQ